MNRAYSVLDIKAVNEDARIIRGIATTPAVDRVGDIVEPEGVKFTNPLPFLWQHQQDKPIGTVKFDKPTKHGINFEAELPHVSEPGVLKDRVDEAWQSIKLGLVRAVSIGFRPVQYDFMERGGIHFKETEVFELSAVTIPAQAQAIITSAKSLDLATISVIKQFDTGAEAPSDLPEIPAKPLDEAATGKTVRVVKLAAPARDRAKPFVIRTIKRLGK